MSRLEFEMLSQINICVCSRANYYSQAMYNCSWAGCSCSRTKTAHGQSLVVNGSAAHRKLVRVGLGARVYSLGQPRGWGS